VDLPGRAVLPANWHFTLRFLGSTPPEQRDKLISCLRATSFGGEFTIRFDRLGAFPRVNRARIVWLGVSDGADRLVSLAEKVEAASRRAGFPAESRPFKPHLTLSRVEPPRAVSDIVSRHAQIAASMTVDRVSLIRSILGGGPAKYEIAEDFFLR
jgi:2'-5' RNA ligase